MFYVGQLLVPHKYNSLPSRSIEHGLSITPVLITALLFRSTVAQAIELGEAMNATARVLVVDDNIDAADMTAEVLRMHGISVVVAYGGLEGLETARLVIPSVIVLDVGMPVMNGCEVAAALRKEEAFQQVKLVALTAWGDSESRERTRVAGFDLHLTKPASLASLVQAVQSSLPP